MRHMTANHGDSFRISHDLSTGGYHFKKLFMVGMQQQSVAAHSLYPQASP